MNVFAGLRRKSAAVADFRGLERDSLSRESQRAEKYIHLKK